MSEYTDDPKPVTEAQKQAMARLYADEGIRSYFMHTIQKANRDAMVSLSSGDMVKSQFYANRFTILKQLLEIGKNEFVNFEMKRSRKDRVVQVEMELKQLVEVNK